MATGSGPGDSPVLTSTAHTEPMATQSFAREDLPTAGPVSSGGLSND